MSGIEMMSEQQAVDSLAWQVSYHSGTWCNVLTRRSLTLLSVTSSYTPSYTTAISTAPHCNYHLHLTFIIRANTQVVEEASLESLESLDTRANFR